MVEEDLIQLVQFGLVLMVVDLLVIVVVLAAPAVLVMIATGEAEVEVQEVIAAVADQEAVEQATTVKLQVLIVVEHQVEETHHLLVGEVVELEY